MQTTLLSYRTRASIQRYQRYQVDDLGIMVTKAKSKYVLSNSNNERSISVCQTITILMIVVREGRVLELYDQDRIWCVVHKQVVFMSSVEFAYY